jgi:quinoprotein dehydrogenase-associated probable ABC transporter substrate-binding protein
MWRPKMNACARRLAGAALAVSLASGAAAQTADLVSETEFRVCADPAAMPFSNEAGEGFENRIAELLAAKLGRPVTYTWYPMATGFVRRTLFEGRCDVIMGYAQGDELVLNTNHYYVSAYSLVTRADGPLAEVDRLSDPRLREARIGIVAGSPPADHMARNGLVTAARPYKLMVDTRVESPADDMIRDLLAGEIDAAVLWGPLAGWRAQNAAEPLVVTPLLREEGPPRLFYRITLGVRNGEEEWKRELNSLLRRNKDEIDAILVSYGVPLVDEFGAAQ